MDEHLEKLLELLVGRHHRNVRFDQTMLQNEW